MIRRIKEQDEEKHCHNCRYFKVSRYGENGYNLGLCKKNSDTGNPTLPTIVFTTPENYCTLWE